MFRHLLAPLVLCMAAFSHSPAEDIAPGSHPREVKASWDGSAEPYYLFVPAAAAKGEPLPLVVALHGKGATWQSWFAGTNVRVVAEREGWIVATPHGRGDWFYLGPGEQDVLDVIADVKAHLAVDESRIYLMGHSMGGWGTWHLAASHPDLFAAIVPMAAWAPLPLLANLRHTPVLVIHGDKDEVIRIADSEAAVERLKTLGVEHQFIVAEGYGHESALISDKMDVIAAWLRGRKLAERPAAVNHSAYLAARGRAWWVDIEGFQTFPALGSIDAVAGPEGVVIKTAGINRFSIDPDRAPAGIDWTQPIMVDRNELLLGESRQLVLDQGKWAVAPGPVAPAPEVLAPADYFGENSAARVADILREELTVDAVLVLQDSIRIAPRPAGITLADIMDLYVRFFDEMYIVEMSIEEFDKTLERTDLWMPVWWTGLLVSQADDFAPTEGRVRVAAPEALARALPHGEKVASGKLLRRLVADRLMRQ